MSYPLAGYSEDIDLAQRTRGIHLILGRQDHQASFLPTQLLAQVDTRIPCSGILLKPQGHILLPQGILMERCASRSALIYYALTKGLVCSGSFHCHSLALGASAGLYQRRVRTCEERTHPRVYGRANPDDQRHQAGQGPPEKDRRLEEAFRQVFEGSSRSHY